MRIAVFSKYVGPTNFLGSRIIVSTKNGQYSIRKTYGWNYKYDPTKNHILAIKEFLQSKGWTKRMRWVIGGYDNGFVACADIGECIEQEGDKS